MPPTQDDSTCQDSSCGDPCDEGCSNGNGDYAQMSGFGGTDAGGMCDGSVNVDGKPGGPPPSTRAARDAVYCAVKVSYNSPMGMELKYNPAEKSVQVKQDNGSNLHFKANPGSATAKRDGVTRKNSCMAQLLNADMTPCITNNPAYVQIANANGSAQTLSVGDGRVTSMTTKTGAVVSRSSYDNQVSVSKDSLGQITSIWSARDGLMEFFRTSTKLTMSRYAPTQVTRNARGVVRAVGVPVRIDSFAWNPSSQSMSIINQEAGKEATVRERTVEGNRVIIATGKDNERAVTSYERNELPGGKWEEIKTVYDTNGSGNTLCERTVKKFTDGGWLVLSRTEGYGTALAETTSYAYNDQYRVTVKSRTDGFYTRYEYDSEGRVTLEASPWADGDYEKVIRTTYADLRFNDHRPATVTVSLMDMSGQETEIKGTTYTYEDSAQVNRTTVSTLAAGETQPLVTIEELNGESPEGYCVYAAGRLRMSQRADGVQKWATYENTAQYGALYKVTVETRANGQAVAGKSERTVQYIAGDETVTREEKHVHTGEGWSLISTEEYEYDGQKRLIKTTRGNGRVNMTTWGCCGPLTEVDEDGVMTTCGYNSARQLVETIRSATATTPERIISHMRDSSGRSLQAREDIGSMHRVLQRTYDILGRVISETDERGRTTTHSYQSHGLKKVTTLPTGTQEITEKNRDGSLHYQALAGRRPVTYSYSPLNNRCTAVRRYSDTMEPGYTETDWNGRTLAEYAASPGAPPQLIASRLYNARGLITESAERGVRTLYEYDSLGNTIQKMLPLADPPSIFNSRIIQYAYAYEAREDGVYRVVTATSYDAEGQPLTSSRAELVSALSSTLESKLVLTDIYGKVTTEWTEYDGETKRKRYQIIPTSIITAEVRYTDGFITYRKDAAGVETSRTIVYTATGSTLTETDGRGNTVTMARDTADRVIRLTDGAGCSIETEYDQVTGKRARVTNENGKTTCYKYDNCGRISAVYGTAARPVCYGYDANGNLSSLTTFRVPGGTISTNPTGRTDGDVTSWEYAWQEDLPIRKTDADNNSVLMSYGAMNRLATVTNARGAVSTRSYNAATGELLSVTHDDGMTANVSYEYNHLGKVTSITDGSGTRNLSYTHYGTLYRDDIQQGTKLCRLQNMYDAYGRLSRYDVEAGNASLLAAVLAYRTDGRPDWTALEMENTLHTFSAQYMANSHLLSGMNLPGGLSQSYAYEENRDLLTGMSFMNGTTPLLSRTYAYDTVERLTVRTREDGSGTQNDTFSYNDRNELTSASLEGMVYGYAYDNTGNRNTAAKGILTTAYQVNALNQYTQIQRAGTAFTPQYDADGNQTKVKTCTGIWTVSYDAENRPISFTSEDGATTVECGYDVDSRRYSQKVMQNGTIVKHERYLYRGFLQVAALDMLQGGIAVHVLLWDPAQPLATRPLALMKGGNVYICTHDQNKNVTELFSEEGQTVTLYDYDPYGAVTVSGAILCPVLWGSEAWDEKLGLTYYNYRYYNPQDGRWLSRDPIGERGGNNLYLFAGNRMGMDWLGLSGEENQLMVCDKNWKDLCAKSFMTGLLLDICNSFPMPTKLKETIDKELKVGEGEEEKSGEDETSTPPSGYPEPEPTLTAGGSFGYHTSPWLRMGSGLGTTVSVATKLNLLGGGGNTLSTDTGLGTSEGEGETLNTNFGASFPVGNGGVLKTGGTLNPLTGDATLTGGVGITAGGTTGGIGISVNPGTGETTLTGTVTTPLWGGTLQAGGTYDFQKNEGMGTIGFSMPL